MTLPTHDVTLCRAHNRFGEPCRQVPIRGGRVCVAHGGRAPQVKAAALERLKALQPKAVTALDQLLDEDNPFARLAAAKDVLDRTGVGKDKSVSGSLTFTLRIDRGDSDD